MHTSKITFVTVAATAILALSSCVTVNNDTGSAHPQPSTTTVVVTPEATPETADTPAPTVQSQTPDSAGPAPQSIGVAPGTSCGPSNTGASTLVVAENSSALNCDQVQSIFAEFNATFTSGDTSNYQIQGFTCHTRSLADVEAEGRSVTCTQSGTRLEAMTYYPLGGVPVLDTSAYKSNKHPYPYHEFRTNFADCEMGGFEGYAISCTGFSNGKPVRISVGQSGLIGQEPLRTVGTYEQVLDSLPSSHSGKYLPAGETLSAYKGACLNSGDSVTCTYKGRSFTFSSTGYTLN